LVMLTKQHNSNEPEELIKKKINIDNSHIITST
jgi:hypothetical protein